MNRNLLKQYSVLVRFLGEVLGPDYEVALHDLNDKTKSIVAIVHGEISGRSLGAPLTAKALEMLVDEKYRDCDYFIHYSGISTGEKPLRSSSLFIKDENGKPLAMLCISFDDSRYVDIAAKVLRLCHPDDYVERTLVTQHIPDINGTSEHFAGSLTALTEDVINGIVEIKGVPVDRLTQDEKMAVVQTLNEKGVFLLKGAVSHVAAKLSSSEASIYRYLGKLNKKRRMESE